MKNEILILFLVLSLAVILVIGIDLACGGVSKQVWGLIYQLIIYWERLIYFEL